MPAVFLHWEKDLLSADHLFKRETPAAPWRVKQMVWMARLQKSHGLRSSQMLKVGSLGAA